MTADDERTPVLVGAAQRTLRDIDPSQVPEPLVLLEEVARNSARDAGLGPDALAALDVVGLVDVIGWQAQNAPRLLAERLGAHPSLELRTAIGGEIPLTLASRVAAEIAAGRARIGLVAGCNTFRALKHAHRAGRQLEWTSGGTGQPEIVGDLLAGSSGREQRYGMSMPSDVYPMFENALRARRGLAPDFHLRRVGALFAGFSEVAAKNPHAWFPVAHSADALITPGPGNRRVAHPYTKYLNAVLDTDQVAGVLWMSVAEARRRGVPEERQVHLWGGAYTQERAWFTSERSDLSASPAMRTAGESVLARAGLTIADVDVFDIYSCFPVAVEMACDMLGIDQDDPRGLTVTGGLPYAGGPGSNYCTHSLAALFGRLRDRPGAVGLVTGNGWFLTKHAALVLASAPRPAGAPRPAEFGAAAASSDPGLEPLPIVEEANGRACIEAYTVLYDRDSAPRRGIVIGRLEAGGRFLANTPVDETVLQALANGEAVGRTGRVAFRDGFNCFEAS